MPRYNCNGWLGVKHQDTYLLTSIKSHNRTHAPFSFRKVKQEKEKKDSCNYTLVYTVVIKSEVHQ